uniref:C-type lectin domain-containing protein n=1 Tax=Monopterus albus TaxID=43700 RepID=A0A3Q3KH13_MONAL
MYLTAEDYKIKSKLSFSIFVLVAMLLAFLSVAAPKLWNSLPLNDGSATHLTTFKSLLKTYLFSWEEALEHCRLNHGDLPSLLNETQDNLALNKINQANITDPVWIGLRYLNDRWLWVNGDPLVYEHWAQGGGEQDHQCPIQKRCGALSTKGWESLDCQNELNFICTRKTDDTPSDKLFKII